ncbi:MAG TPA: M23 family metallopeptidase [Anaerolineales bacterium]|nr:M23 family metallopeptidase [Anaerolineales bacterium]
MPLSDEFPLDEGEAPVRPTGPTGNIPQTTEANRRPQEPSAPGSNTGLDLLLRYGMHAAALLLVVVIGWVVRYYYVEGNIDRAELPQQAALAAPVEAPAGQADDDTEQIVALPSLGEEAVYRFGIPRFAVLHTTIPARPRVDVITYTVQAGDTVFGIAEFYGLRAETIFWGNQEVLGDDPHRLFPGQVLNILPIDGVYHKYSAGEDLARVAEFYGVDAPAILEWPGNQLDLVDANLGSPEISPGTWLIVPGGEREFVDFGPPRILRSNPAAARTYGPGHCGEIYDGAVGSGTFMWPTTERWISGYDFNPAANHSGIDIAGQIGNPVWAADAGVVVYSGWSYLGYGNLVVIDHGQWQTVYAHLSDFYVFCGMSVFQGATIGTVGSTGNSSGPHLHFELMYLSAKVNPWDYMSP